MKKNRSEKNKFNVASVKNSYCIALGNAGERTQGTGGPYVEGYAYPRGYRLDRVIV